MKRTLRELSNLSTMKNDLLIKSLYSYTNRKIVDNQLSNERNICFSKSNRPIRSMVHIPDEYNELYLQIYESVKEAKSFYFNYFKYIRDHSHFYDYTDNEKG